jgi:cytochrome b561
VVVFLFLLFQTNDVKHVPWSERAAKMGHFVFKAIWWFWILPVSGVCCVPHVSSYRAVGFFAFVVLRRPLPAVLAEVGGVRDIFVEVLLDKTLFMRTSIHEDHSLAGLSG